MYLAAYDFMLAVSHRRSAPLFTVVGTGDCGDHCRQLRELRLIPHFRAALHRSFLRGKHVRDTRVWKFFKALEHPGRCQW